MARESFDIIVSGGGVAGLTAAAGFGAMGLRLLCVDPTPPVTVAEDAGADLRTTALLQPAVALLDEIGLWARFAPHATALQVMRIVDAGGPAPEARVAHDFDAADISDQPFGWNLPNWLLRRELVAHLEHLPNVTFRPGVGTTRVFTRENVARVSMNDGSVAQARISLWKREARSSSRAKAGGRTFRATVLPIWESSASYTSAIPPWPSRRRMRYLPNWVSGAKVFICLVFLASSLRGQLQRSMISFHPSDVSPSPSLGAATVRKVT